MLKCISELELLAMSTLSLDQFITKMAQIYFDDPLFSMGRLMKAISVCFPQYNHAEVYRLADKVTDVYLVMVNDYKQSEQIK